MVSSETPLMSSKREEAINLWQYDIVPEKQLASDGLDLCAASHQNDEMQRRFLLNVVVGERLAVSEQLSGEDEALLVDGDTGL